MIRFQYNKILEIQRWFKNKKSSKLFYSIDKILMNYDIFVNLEDLPLNLNTYLQSIANKYREGKVKKNFFRFKRS